MTLERVPLPPPVGEYALEWLDGDFSVCDTASDDFLEGDRLFSKLIVSDPESGVQKVASWSSQRRRWRVIDLFDARTDYKNMRVTLFVGPTRAAHEVSVAMLRLHRHSNTCT